MPSDQPTEIKRLHSLDALRGFDMFWIMGGEGIFVALAALTGWPFLQWWSGQLEHVAWNGFHFYDMIFPLFLFIAGISFPFSLAKRKGRESRKSLYYHVIKRGLLLVLLGVIYNNAVNFDFAGLRYGSVLGRIGLAWMFGALIFMNTEKTGIRLAWFWGLLILYWLALLLFPAHDLGTYGPFSMQGSLTGWIDRMFMPGKLYLGIHDPEGILSTIPAISTALMGMLTGQFILSQQHSQKQLRNVLLMILVAIGFMILGKVWDLAFPICKNLWSSSFVCFVGGLSLLLFSLFYLVIDVWGFKKWTSFFVVIGMNSITVYLAHRIIDFQYTARFLFGGIIALFPVNWAPFLTATGFTAVVWIFLYILYRKNIFLKI